MTESAPSTTPEHHDGSPAAEAAMSGSTFLPGTMTRTPEQSEPAEAAEDLRTLAPLDSLDSLGTFVAATGDEGGPDAGRSVSATSGDTADGHDDAAAIDNADGADGADNADGADGADNADGVDGVDGVDGAPRRGNRVRLLEKEGEVAADFLERLLDIADLDGDIEVDIDGDRAAVAIVDSEDGRVPRRLVGADGKVLEALQELTRLAVQAETGERSRLMLDVAGHRAQRRTVLVELAHTAIAEVKTTGSKKALDDMSAFERKIVHDEVASAGLESESEGVEPHRHIVVFPA